MKEWLRIDDRKSISKIGFRQIVRKRFQMNNGAIIDADIVGQDGAAAAGIIALTPENKVIIARQFRCGPEQIMDEMPGGIVDPDEKPEQAAVRELQEEVGYSSESIEYLGSSYVNAWSNSVHHYYLARNCQKNLSANPDQFEEIEIDVISIEQLIDNARNGKMTDGIGVFMAYDKLKELL